MKDALSKLALLLSTPCCKNNRNLGDAQEGMDGVATDTNPSPKSKVDIIESAIQYISCSQRHLHNIQSELTGIEGRL
jgi:hypothetical protein